MSLNTKKEFFCSECGFMEEYTLKDNPYYCPNCGEQGTLYPFEAGDISPLSDQFEEEEKVEPEEFKDYSRVERAVKRAEV